MYLEAVRLPRRSRFAVSYTHLWRQGQKETVVVHHLVVKGTMDEQVMQALKDKAAGQNALMAAVRARIKKTKED